MSMNTETDIITLADDVANVMRICGGTAHLDELYKLVGVLRLATGRSTPRSFRDNIRQCVESNSRGRGRDCFVKVGELGDGIWGLKVEAEADIETVTL